MKNKKYRFNPKNPPKRILKKLKRLEYLIGSLQSDGVYFMADGRLHAFVSYNDGSRDEIGDKTDSYSPFHKPHLAIVAGKIESGDFW